MSPPPPPWPLPQSLVIGVAAVTNFGINSFSTRFICHYEAAYQHAASGIGPSYNGEIAIPITAVGDIARAQFVAGVQVQISGQLESTGSDVPAERIAVTLL